VAKRGAFTQMCLRSFAFHLCDPNIEHAGVCIGITLYIKRTHLYLLRAENGFARKGLGRGG